MRKFALSVGVGVGWGGFVGGDFKQGKMSCVTHDVLSILVDLHLLPLLKMLVRTQCHN